ncbi:hypothetical protein [Marinifilum sp. D737]|uniref:hypothetical protein n=1 Tax=Marinifilum sp. D737 TaxID=2969628 RepID=UPI002272F970|nr:hypothetical protein [Marinifilum sp. D737]MCY1636535.1 hypothetical protein [Marinifilum sp. D737]
MKYFFIICIALVMSSCASSYLSSERITNSQNYYNRIFVVSIFDPINFREFNEESYNNQIMEQMNDFSAIAVRKLMKRKVINNFNNNRIQVKFSQDVFTVNKNIDYNQFNKTISKLESNAILIIQQSNFFYTQYIESDCNGRIETKERPRGVFFTYLIDAKTHETIWAGRFDSSGTSYDGKYSLYNNMCRKLHKQLIKEKLIPAPFYTKK